MAIFHFTVKIVGRSKGKSVISASAYLNGDVMKNEETGRISYYTSKKEVVYTSLMMCENAPPEWLHVPEENIKRFQQSIRYKRADDKDAALEKFKITFQKQRLWNEVLKIEKNADAQLGRSFEFSLPKEWSRQEQIDYTTEYIQKTFVDEGMCADWSIHDKGDGNPHVHLLVTMRPFNPDHSWGNKEVKDWDFVRDTDGNIVVDESHPDWWQDKKNPDRHGIRIPVLDENGVQKVGARNRKQWKRVLTDATGWNNPKNCELWRSEWAKMCNRHLSIDNLIDQAEQERDYALSHQKKVEIPVEKPVLYQKCGNCNLTAYLKAKEKYDTQREKLAGRYKTKTAMYEALMFLLIWYSVSTTLFQMIRSKIFISDCVVFFDTIATFIQTIAGWIILTGKNMAQISNGISNPVVAGIVYWLIRILICGGCLVGAGILVAFIEIKIAELYKKCCWDMITIMVILISMATAIYFGKWIKTTLPINLLFLLLFVQLVYVGIRWYVKGWRETRGYH